MATRSPVLGYNHNVKYKGRIYHVQTEDSGPTNPHLFTHLYFEGTILATKRHEYDVAETEAFVRALMQDQHKAILKDLKHEVYDGKLAAFFARRGEGHDLLAPAEVPLAAAPPPEPMPFIETVPEPEVELEVAAEVILDPMPDMPTIPVEVPPPMELAPPAAALEIPPLSIEIEMPPPAPPDALPPLEVVLDLDALPASTGATPPPEVAPPPSSSPGGPGVYTYRRPAVDKTPSVPPPHIRREHPSQVMPVVVFDPVAERPAAPPPPAAPQHPAPRPTTRVPVPPQPAAHARPPSVRPTQSPVSPVVVQRQVVVGTGGNRAAPGGGRPRRPAPSIPYVVKEGSHPTVQAPQPRQPNTRSSGQMPAVGSVPPARPMVPPPPTSANASRTASQSPRPQPAEISDKSLDEVILAYLAKGEGPE